MWNCLDEVWFWRQQLQPEYLTTYLLARTCKKCFCVLNLHTENHTAGVLGDCLELFLSSEAAVAAVSRSAERPSRAVCFILLYCCCHLFLMKVELGWGDGGGIYLSRRTSAGLQHSRRPWLVSSEFGLVYSVKLTFELTCQRLLGIYLTRTFAE